MAPDESEEEARMNAIADKSLAAAMDILRKLDLTEQEQIVCLTTAAYCTDVARTMILQHGEFNSAIRANKCVAAALAASLAAYHTKMQELEKHES